MKNSGIWINVEVAQKAAEDTLLFLRLLAWRKYMYFCRWCRTTPIFPFCRKPSYKKYLKRRDKITDSWHRTTEKGERKYWRTNTQQAQRCFAVIKACKIPPVDGRIFLTLDTLESIGL